MSTRVRGVGATHSGARRATHRANPQVTAYPVPVTPEIVTVLRPLSMIISEAAAAVDGGPVSTVALVIGLAGALVLALVLAEVTTTAVRALAVRRGRERTVAVATATRGWLRALFLALAAWGAVLLLAPDDAGWRVPVARVLLALAIAGAGILVGIGVMAALPAAATDRARTRRTVVLAAIVAVLGPLAVAGALAVAPPTRPAAVVVLALAVLAWIAAAVVARPLWRSVTAGLRLAFTDVVRVGDVLEHEGELARVESLGWTTGVLQRWDDRRVVVPHEHWFAGPVVNLTRRAADLLGTVEVVVAPDVVVADLRGELERLLQNSATWDHRVGILQVVDATAGLRVRAVISAADPGALEDLRAQVREGLVEWLRTGGVRPVEPLAAGGEVTQETVRLDLARRSMLFGPAGRVGGFAGPGPEVLAEREEAAHRRAHRVRRDDRSRGAERGTEGRRRAH